MKLNKEDHAILVKLLENGFKWVARDKDGFLFAYKEKPIKKHTFDGEWDVDMSEPAIIERRLLEFIKWEDEDPTEISKVLDLHDSAVEKEETGFKAGDKVWVDFPEYFNRDTVYTVKRIDSLGYADFTDTIYTAHTTRLSKAVTEEPVEKKLIDVTTVGERDLAKLHERYLLLDYHPEYTIRDFKEGAFGIARATYEVKVYKLIETGEDS